MTDLIYGIAVPAVAAGALFLISMLFVRDRPVSCVRNAPAWLAVPAAVMCAYALLLGPSLQIPSRSTEWLPWVALIGGIAGGVCALSDNRLFIVWPVRIFVSALVVMLPLLSLYKNTWPVPTGIAWAVGMGGAVLIAWTLNQRTAVTTDPRAIGALGWFVSVATAVSLVLSGSALLAQMAGVLAACLGAVVVLGFFFKSRKVDAGTVAAFTVFHTVLVMQGFHYGELPLTAAIALPMALPLASLLSLPAWNTRPVWQRAAARTIIVLIPLTIAVAQCARIWLVAQESSGGYGY